MSKRHGIKGRFDREQLQTFYAAGFISFDELCARCPTCPQCARHKARKSKQSPIMKGTARG